MLPTQLRDTDSREWMHKRNETSG